MAPAREQQVTKARILEQSCRTTYDFYFARLVMTVDSPKFTFNIAMDAFKPLLGPRYQVC